jgi:hypothetical protein
MYGDHFREACRFRGQNSKNLISWTEDLKTTGVKERSSFRSKGSGEKSASHTFAGDRG